jgi:cystathionine beta-lyase/cystathionine gamma-synthase
VDEKISLFMKKRKGFSTTAIHVGQDPDPVTGAVIPPVYLTTNYKQKYPGEMPLGYLDYTRAYNPNFTNLEQTLAALENADYATIFSSGLGATSALLATLNPGDHILAIDDMYGGTYRLLDRVFSKYSITFDLVDMRDITKVEQAFLTKKPVLCLLETPTNPFLKIADIEAITRIAKKYKTKTVVDNTFASPYLQNPLDLGADIVLHSSTKYIGGHSDVVGGVIMSNDKSLRDKLEFHRKAIGLNPSPFDAWLLSRSVKTLAVRMDRNCENAMKVAQFLTKHPLVKNVYYPGLTTHQNHNIAKKQMRGFGGIVSVEFNLSFDDMVRVITSLKLFTLAESLGAVESLVDHPASMTHLGIPAEKRKELGIHDGLIRLSVGIENAEDLIKDLTDALRLNSR